MNFWRVMSKRVHNGYARQLKVTGNKRRIIAI